MWQGLELADANEFKHSVNVFYFVEFQILWVALNTIIKTPRNVKLHMQVLSKRLIHKLWTHERTIFGQTTKIDTHENKNAYALKLYSL